MHQERVKIRLRAFTISKIFRGFTPGPPWREDATPSRTHPQHGLAVRGGASRPRLRRPRFSRYPHALSYTPKREIMGKSLAGSIYQNQFLLTTDITN
jgi:hypothetical protein